jgi:hypothetical protein
MSTPQQIEANRRNGALGGPKTPEGKAIASQNARKHGIFAAAITELDQAELHTIHDTFSRQYRPVGMIEETLIEKMAITYLRLQRCALAEAKWHAFVWRPTRVRASRPWPELGEDVVTELRFDEFERMVNIFSRYDLTLTNQLTRLIREFMSLRSHRKAHPEDYAHMISATPADAAPIEDIAPRLPARSEPDGANPNDPPTAPESRSNASHEPLSPAVAAPTHEANPAISPEPATPSDPQPDHQPDPSTPAVSPVAPSNNDPVPHSDPPVEVPFRARSHSHADPSLSNPLAESSTSRASPAPLDASASFVQIRTESIPDTPPLSRRHPTRTLPPKEGPAVHVF